MERSSLVLFAGILVLSIGVTLGCSQQDLLQCENAFLAAIGTTRAQAQAGEFPDIDRAQLNRTCTAWKAYDACFRPFIDNCPREIRLEFQGLDDLYEFVCEKAFEEHLLYAPCFDGDEISKETELCVATMLARIRVALSRSRRCTALNEGLDCVVSLARQYCGVAAAYHRRELEVASIKPLADDIQCQLRGGVPGIESISTTEVPSTEPGIESTSITEAPGAGDPNPRPGVGPGPGRPDRVEQSSSEESGISTGAIAGIVAGMLGVLILVILLVFIILYIRKKNQAQQSAHETYVNPAHMQGATGGAAHPGAPPPSYDNVIYEDTVVIHGKTDQLEFAKQPEYYSVANYK